MLNLYPKIYIINLENNTERLEFIEKQLNELDLDYEIFKAVDGRLLTEFDLLEKYDKQKAIETLRELTPGEIGCALSHLGVYQEIINYNFEGAIVVEDDAFFNSDFKEILLEFNNSVNKKTDSIVLLNYVKRYFSRNNIKLNNKYFIAKLHPNYLGYSAFSYYITYGAAKKMIDNIYPIHSVSDNWSYFAKELAINFQAIIPFLVSHKSGESNLENDRKIMQEKYKLKKIRRSMKYKIKRALYDKLIYKLFLIISGLKNC